MNLPYVKVFGDLSATVDLLSDAEAGRLLKSLLHYINGGEDELLGQEKLVFAMLKSQIDRDSASYAAFTDKQRENGKKGGRPPKANAFSENPKNPSLFSETQKSQEKEKDKEKDKEEDEDKDIKGAKAPSRARKAAPDVLSSLASEVQAAFRDFVAMRVKMRKPMTDRAIALAVGKLLEVAGDDPSAQVAAINRTIEHGWQTFYPDDRPAQTARSGTIHPIKRVNAQQYTQREYTAEEFDNLFEEL